MSLSVNEQMLIEQRVSNEARSIVVAYALWFFTGGLGGHRFYLGRTRSAIAMLALTVLGVLTTVVMIGFLLLLAVGIWMIVDAFRIPNWIAEGRAEIRDRLTREMTAATG